MRRAGQEATLLVSVTVLALIIWFVIADTENQEVEARLGFSLEVEVTDLSADLAVTSDPLPVTVTVIGREVDLAEARPEQFRASISLRNRSAGRHNLPVRVEALEGGVRVRAVQPETAVVILQETVEREVPVSVELANPPPLGFSVGDSEAMPATAIVSGLAVDVENVASVVARLDLGGANVSLEREVALEPRTAAGSAVSQVRVNPRFAVVRVPIEQEVFRRTYTVLPRVVGTPADGFRVRSISTDPSTVDVLVSIEGLDDEATLETGPIDITGFDSDVLIETPLVFGASAAPAPESEPSVQALVMIEPVVSTVTAPLLIAFEGLAENLRIAFSSARRVQVTLRGPVGVLSELEAELEPIVVDLAGLGVGRHVLDLSWQGPDGLTLTVLSPVQVVVTLAAIPPPETQSESDDQSDSEVSNGPANSESNDSE